MPYIIDGNNVIGAVSSLDIRDPEAREKLTHLLSRYQKTKGNTLTVVYDGPPPEGAPKRLHLGRLRVVYAGPEQDADTVIKQMVKTAARPAEIIVVSSDKQVYSYCKWAGAQAIRVLPFYAEVEQTLARKQHAATENLSPEDVDDWLSFFGIEEKEL